MSEQQRRGFRPSARRRNRIAAGVALGAAAIGGNVLVYSSVDDREAVVQVIRDVPAGEVITADMLRTVDVDLDGTVLAVPGEQIDLVVGKYAKVRLVSGSLVVGATLQSEPLVTAGSSVLAVQVADGGLPIGLRERSPVQLVMPARAADGTAPTVVEGRVVGLPSTTTSLSGTRSLSVEVAADDAPTVAAADDVRIVLLEPSELSDGSAESEQ